MNFQQTACETANFIGGKNFSPYALAVGLNLSGYMREIVHCFSLHCAFPLDALALIYKRSIVISFPKPKV